MHKTSCSKDYLRFPCAAVWSGKFFVHCSREGNKHRQHRFAIDHRKEDGHRDQQKNYGELAS